MQNLGSVNEQGALEIVETYQRIQGVLGDLDTLHTAIIQKHETDFMMSYKEHMLKVQTELVELKKRSSEYYQNMKKQEKIRMLEQSIGWLRDESIKLAAQIDNLKENNKVQRANLNVAHEEIKNVNENAQTLQWHNIILKNTIQKLKSPNQIAKYEQRGYERAVKELRSQGAFQRVTAGASTKIDNNNLDQTNRAGIFDVTDQELIDKIRFMQQSASSGVKENVNITERANLP